MLNKQCYFYKQENIDFSSYSPNSSIGYCEIYIESSERLPKLINYQKNEGRFTNQKAKKDKYNSKNFKDAFERFLVFCYKLKFTIFLLNLNILLLLKKITVLIQSNKQFTKKIMKLCYKIDNLA